MGQKRQIRPARRVSTAEPIGQDRFKTWQRWLPALIFCVAVGVYLNTLGHGFQLDDSSLILQSPEVINLQWRDVLGTTSYRPVRTFTYALNYAIGGTDPTGYHLFNILLHGLNACLVFGLFRTWSRSAVVSGIGALFFALHPAQTAAVAYISGRKDLLATFFVVLACHSYTMWRLKGGRARLILAFLFFVLGALSKEVAIVFPALVLLIDVVLLRAAGEDGVAEQTLAGRIGRSLARRPLVYGSVGVLLMVGVYYAVFYMQASRMTGFWGGTASVHYGTSFKLFVHYARLVLFPYPLLADYSGSVFTLSSGFLDPATLACLAAFIGFVLLALKLETKHPQVAFGFLWFLVALIPVLQFIPFHELAADHFLYLPLVGVALVVGHAAAWIAAKHGTHVRDALVFGILLLFAIATVDRNADWKNEETLWTATLAKAPGSFRANHYLGNIYFQKKDVRKAIEHTRRAVDLASDPKKKASALSNLGAMYRYWAADLRSGKALQQAEMLNNEAIGYFRDAIELNPADLWAYASQGQAFRELAAIAEQRGDTAKAAELRQEAVKSYQSAISIGSSNPGFPLVWFEMAKVFMDHGSYNEAIVHLSTALKSYPQRADILYALGTCYFNLRQYQEAIQHLRKSTEIQSNLESLGMLGKSYEALGENEQAIGVYETAAMKFPQSVEIQYNLGVLYYRSGDLDRATAHLETGLKLSPNGPLAVNIRKMLDVINADASDGAAAEPVPQGSAASRFPQGRVGIPDSKR